MSERQVRLLYKTTCRTCGAPIAAGTVTWWDDDRRHAVCTECFGDHDAHPDGSLVAPASLDQRTRRRIQIIRAHRPRVPAR